MNKSIESRHALSPEEVAVMKTSKLREKFLIENIFEKDAIHLILSFYDRFIAGGAMPVNNGIELPNPENLKAAYFLERREMGIINVGGKGMVEADGERYELEFKDALYISKETKKVIFTSADKNNPAKFYINSAPAHHKFSTKKVSRNEAETVTLGTLENSNHRTINKLLVASVVETSQLQMGMTELKPGNVWNTMPAHTHDRRMEVYFYFDIPQTQAICHFMGEPQESRHIWMKNEQAVISPNWSIHAGAGTSNYSFIWGMAGENLDYGDMDLVDVEELR